MPQNARVPHSDREYLLSHVGGGGNQTVTLTERVGLRKTRLPTLPCGIAGLMGKSVCLQAGKEFTKVLTDTHLLGSLSFLPLYRGEGRLGDSLEEKALSHYLHHFSRKMRSHRSQFPVGLI